MKVIIVPFGHLIDGQEVKKYTIAREDGAAISFLNYGGIVSEIKVPDKDSFIRNVVHGFETFMPYKNGHPYFGTLVGRYANRIERGVFELKGKRYQLEKNHQGNHLHGGNGFDKAMWSVDFEGNKAILTYHSPDGEDLYPGNLDVTVEYEFTEDLNWHLRYRATTDKTTIINLTNHCYFNLDNDNDSILDHELKIYADSYLPVDETSIPLAEAPRNVSGSPFDFREWKKIGMHINEDHEQIKRGGGYDHSWVRSLNPSGKVELIAEAKSSNSGRLMKVYTSEPGVQLFSANYGKTIKGESGEIYPERSGFCLETQHFPNSPNRPDFPSTVLSPGEVYESETIYSFSTV